jgi:hypothetical protein
LFKEVSQGQAVGLTGVTWRLPSGTNLPEGLDWIADGSDVGGPHAPGHHTIFPTRAMPFQEFNDLVHNLPWERGKRIK